MDPLVRIAQEDRDNLRSLNVHHTSAVGALEYPASTPVTGMSRVCLLRSPHAFENLSLMEAQFNGSMQRVRAEQHPGRRKRGQLPDGLTARALALKLHATHPILCG
jgi:hypothetical protein